ncbi:MAG TPA: aspartate ammonia-lyase [Ignavibacteria bacterium]|nr:aspartate ammonia-lyase [Ignavibacteria bacterium]
MDINNRIESDFLGEAEIPSDAYYGVQSVRARENFRITGRTLNEFPHFIRALAHVKKSAAIANNMLGALDDDRRDVIEKACDDVIAGKYNDQFIVDMMQGGAGTSTNMNANEVIANLALEYAGREKGDYDYIHPNNHINLSQSTNDVYPTSIKIATYFMTEELLESIKRFKEALEEKERQFDDVLKMGRTQLQDAVPMTLGQEFGAYAVMVGEDLERITYVMRLISEINMGATAIGTQINTPEGYTDVVSEILRQETKLPLVASANLVEATQDTGVFIHISGVLKRYAVKISKICNDLRLLSSGPRAGLNEINLPPMQPGSSIMPGKVNPVIPEVVNQVAFQVIGNDLTITMACEAGQLELNVMEPVIAFRLFDTLNILRNGTDTLTEKCIKGITANREVCLGYVENSIGLCTVLVPVLGYEAASSIAKEALRTNDSVYNLVLEKGLMSEEELKEILRPETMIRKR